MYGSMKRTPGSKYQSSSDERGKIREKVRDYLLSELRTDDNFSGDMTYSIVDNLKERFIKDTTLGAGLVIYLSKLCSTLQVSCIVGVDPDFINEEKIKAIESVTNFFGKEIDNYQTRLEELIEQLKN